jgi:hypothetical protein
MKYYRILAQAYGGERDALVCYYVHADSITAAAREAREWQGCVITRVALRLFV